MNSLISFRNTAKALLPVLYLAAAAACSEKIGNDDNGGGSGPVQELSFAVEEFSPVKGPRGTKVAFTGEGFGTEQENVKVLFNEKEAKILSLDDDRIEVEVPVLPGEECIVRVQVGGEVMKCPVTFDYQLQMYVSTLVGGEFTNNNPGGKPDNKPVTDINPADGTPFSETKFCNPIDSEIYADSEGNVYFSVDGKDSKKDVYMADISSGILKLVTSYGVNGTDLVLCFDSAKDILYGFVTDAYSLDGFSYSKDAGYYALDSDDNGSIWDSTEGFPEQGQSGTARRAVTVHRKSGKIYALTNYILTEIDPSAGTGRNLGRVHKDINPKDGKNCSMTGDPADADILYISVEEDGRVYRYNIKNGDCSRYAGSGYGNLDNFGDGELGGSMFNHPRQMYIDSRNNMYVADEWHCAIRKISMPAGTISTYVGKKDTSKEGYADGLLGDALLDNPVGVAVDAKGAIYIVDKDNFAIRRVALE